jgi:hypothetical protein|tara:strand:+ start:4749 stop:5225 length:477 start_codon:yes stop_codon:yes gene_type:complete
MSSVVRRTFKSTPERDASATWTAIIDLLVQGKSNSARAELEAVGGVAASVIADQSPKDAAIITTCDGPRTRIYCLYDDNAIDGSDAYEEALPFDPLKGDWRVSLPCNTDDLEWVQNALKQHSTRITARDLDAAVGKDENVASEKSQNLVLDTEGFLGS